MTVREIIKLVCEFVGEKEIAKKLNSNLGWQFSDIENEKIESMVNCFNLVNQEIASDYLPFLIKEAVDVSNCILTFSSLTKKVLNIYEIKNKFGMNLKFNTYADYVEVFGNAKSVVYSFLPEELSIDDNLQMVNGLSARVYAYGVASEYLFVDGLSEDAELWDERFKESLFVLSRKRGEHSLPRRRWL